MLPSPEPAPRPIRDPSLDGLRGVAILLVFLFHYGGGLRSGNPAVHAFGYLTQAGWIGVELFFALSGFLITRLLWQDLGQPHALRNFYARRALRILPVYFGALVAAILAALFTGSSVQALRPILLYTGFLQNLPGLVPIALRYPPPLPLHHLWSLAVEEQFYLLWPSLLLAAGTRRRALHLYFWTFAASCLFRFWVWGAAPFPSIPSGDWSAFPLTRAGALALGGALALLPFEAARRSKHWAFLALAAGGLSFAVLAVQSGTLLLSKPQAFMLGLPAVELACAAAVALAICPGLWRTWLSYGPLAALGRISYGFYVLHILLEPLFDRIGFAVVHTSSGSGYQLVRLLVAFPVTLAASWLSYLFIEQPFLRWKRFFRRAPSFSRQKDSLRM